MIDLSRSELQNTSFCTSCRVVSIALRRGVGRLKTARPVGVLGRAFFSNFCVASLSKQLFYVIISGAPFSSIFNHLRYSLNTSHKAFRHVTTAREMRRPACEVLSSLDALRLPSPVPEECHSRCTNRTVHITLGVPNSKH
jgi:hypothetical protein